MTARRATVRPAQSGFEVYDGLTPVGRVEPASGGFLARDARGRAIGKFATSRDAVRVLVRLAQERGAP